MHSDQNNSSKEPLSTSREHPALPLPWITAGVRCTLFWAATASGKGLFVEAVKKAFPQFWRTVAVSNFKWVNNNNPRDKLVKLLSMSLYFSLAAKVGWMHAC